MPETGKPSVIPAGADAEVAAMAIAWEMVNSWTWNDLDELRAAYLLSLDEIYTKVKYLRKEVGSLRSTS